MQTATTDPSLRIAVIGGGVAGITAAYLLQKRHEVTLYDKNDYIGGHTNTVTIPHGPDAGMPVDTGFIVLNDRTYPVLNRFFRRLDVSLGKSDMSFSYYSQKSGFQYASSDINSLFAQRGNLLDPGYWAMLVEILKFNRTVLHRLENGRLGDVTLGAFLHRHNYSTRFRKQYLYPMVAAIWSAPDDRVAQFPMLTFARFFDNHGLLSVFNHPQWHFVKGGSQTYVQAFLRQFRGTVYASTAIDTVERSDNRVSITEFDGTTRQFDRVVIATHADEALDLLADPTDEERRLLGPWQYSTNLTYLHTDLRWMPTNRNAWASWNFIRGIRANAQTPVTLTYYMNRLQRLNTDIPYLVTLNPFEPISDDQIIARMTYTHPTFTFDSLKTQSGLPDLNGVRNTCFCGSYFGYGFHEDAARSGVQAAAALGARHEL